MNNSDNEQSQPQEKQLVEVSLGINLKDEFETYEAFDKKLKALSKKHFVHFWKRDCRTVEGAKKKTERYIDPKIKYYQLKYSCVHGGRMFKRKNQILKKECEANFYLIATPDGSKLYVKSLNNYHNHEVSEAQYMKYFIEERVRRGRPRKNAKLIKEEVHEDDEYTSGYIYGKYESDIEDGDNVNLENTAEYPISMNVQQYESPTDQNTTIQYDSNTCNQDSINVLHSTKDDNIDQFLKYLGSEIKQIKNKKIVKALKRKFISMVQKAQDEEDSA